MPRLHSNMLSRSLPAPEKYTSLNALPHWLTLALPHWHWLSCIVLAVAAATSMPTVQAPRFSERLMADGKEVLRSLAAMQLAHSNKEVQRAAGAALLAAQRQARRPPD